MIVICHGHTQKALLMNQLDDPCDICGDVGFAEHIVTCFQCKMAKEHGYRMREVLLTIPEIWFCEECRLSKAIASSKSVIVEDVPVSSTSITFECVCTSPVLKLSKKSVHDKREMASKSNPSKTLSPGGFLKNQERSGHACKQVAARIGNVKKSSGPSKSEHLPSNLVSRLDQSSTMATVSKSNPTRFKAAPAKLPVKKIKASHEHRKIGHSCARFGSNTQQKANQTSKNLKDKKTSAICEKKTHATFMPGEKIETSRSQGKDSEQVSPDGFVSLSVDMIASTLAERDLNDIARKYHIDTIKYHLSLPKSSQRANSNFPRKHTFCIYADAFKAGLRLPLHPLIPAILREFGVASTQITPNSWRVLICFISFCCSQKITPTVNLFRAIYSLKDRSGDGKGWWFFCARNGLKLFDGFPSSTKGWKSMFFIISTSEMDCLRVNTKWGHPNGAANQSLTPSAEEVKSLDDLLAAATNNPPDFKVLLSEEALIQAGISSALLKSKGSKGEVKQNHSLSQSGLVRALKRKRAAAEAGKCSEEARIQAGISSALLKSKGSKGEVKQHHSLSQSGLVRTLKRQRAATKARKSSWSALPCQDPILADEDQEGQPQTKRPKEPQQRMEETDLLQPTELTNQPQEIVSPVTSAPLAPNGSPHEVVPQQPSLQFSIQRIAGSSAPTVSCNSSGIASGDFPPSNAKVMPTGSVEYMVLPHYRDFVAQKHALDMNQELMCQAMEMDREIHMLKGERNELRTELESKKMAVAELESARKATVELQSLSEKQIQKLEKKVEQMEIKLKETQEKARTRKDRFAKLKSRLKLAKHRAEYAERKAVAAEEKWHQSELAESTVAEETLKNFKASQEFLDLVENCNAEAYGLGLDAAIEKLKRQYPDLDLSMIDFYAEEHNGGA